MTSFHKVKQSIVPIIWTFQKIAWKCLKEESWILGWWWWMLHYVPINSALNISDFWTKNYLTVLPQPPNSPYLASLKRWWFDKTKGINKNPRGTREKFGYIYDVIWGILLRKFGWISFLNKFIKNLS